MKFNFLTLTFLLILFHYKCVCQYNREAQVTGFTNRMNNPVKIEVNKNDRDELTFSAQNRSLFPYEIQLEFLIFQNLTPVMNKVKKVVYPGYSTLFELSILDKKVPHNYSYNMRYVMGDPKKKADTSFKYLLPLGEGKEIKLFERTVASEKIFLGNVFMVEPDDTIYSIRKGTITCTPLSNDNFERIVNGSIEVLQADGTVATYIISDSSNILVEPTQKVYPLQPLAIIKKPGTLKISVFQFKDDGRLSQLTVKYENTNTETYKLNNTLVKHSRDIMEMELTNGEKKKLRKGNLY